MKIAVTTVQVPFIKGGAEAMTSGLTQALRNAGHNVEVITTPFKFAPKEAITATMDYWENCDFDCFDCGSIDQVISLKFPTYYLQHPNKTVWLMHQHRSVYELFNTQFGVQDAQDTHAFQKNIMMRDTNHLSAIPKVYTISQTVSDRLRQFNNVNSEALYQPPPMSEQYCSGPVFPYVFFPSRLENLKRQELLIRAMEYVDNPVIAIIAGEGGMFDYYQKLILQLGVEKKVRLVGRITDWQMLSYYKNALAVFFAPFAEDYGFVTLEAMLSAKPVITCCDSGGPTEFVLHGETGHIVTPAPELIADAINLCWRNVPHAMELGRNGLEHYKKLGISWDNVVNTLLEGSKR